VEKRARGQIRLHERRDGQVTYSLRVRAYGRREILTLGTDTDGWTYRKAERMLDRALAEIEVGVWRPPRSQAIGDADQTFHVFASRWWGARRAELRPTTQADYDWRLRKHLLPFFADFRVSDITVAVVDEYRNEKVVERERIRTLAEAGMPVRDKRGQRRVALSNESINKTLVLLANILDAAVEYELLPSNPARGKRRRLKAARPARRFLEADELGEVLAAAAELDRVARSDHRIGRRPMIAVMAKSGLRVSEVCQLRWRSVDLHHKRLVVEQAKTDASVREVDLSLDLLDELLAWRADSPPDGVDAFVFPTASGRARDKDSVRERVLAPVISRVNEIRVARGLPPLPKTSDGFASAVDGRGATALASSSWDRTLPSG
jgi:integrase